MSIASFNVGDVFRLHLTGVNGVVINVIGSGGQGRVYECQVSNKRVALKCFHSHVLDNDVNLLSRIEELIRIGPPDTRYLWPFDFALNKKGELCGYLMPLIKQGYVPLRKTLSDASLNFFDFEICLRSCIEIAISFYMLHSRGLSFQDLNLGAFFIKPSDGSVCICDPDNVSNNGSVGGVFGTRKFMAPEIVLGKSLPSAETDLFSMAIIFFYILYRSHPLEGRRDHELEYLDAQTENKIYGQDPVFIFNPVDTRNPPVPIMHDFASKRWIATSKELKNLFIRAFTNGLFNPETRVLEAEWIRVFSRSHSFLYGCPSCGEYQIFDKSSQYQESCRFCSNKIEANFLISTGHRYILASVGAFIYEHHFKTQNDGFDFIKIGVVERHPINHSVIGLKNLGPYQWVVTSADGRTFSIEQGKAVELVPSLLVDFGCGRAKVKRVEYSEVYNGESSE